MREHGASVDGRSKVVGARRSRAQLRLEDGPQDVQRRLAVAAERRSDLLVEYGNREPHMFVSTHRDGHAHQVPNQVD